MATKVLVYVEVYEANDTEWEAYKQKFGKNYQAHEEAEKRKAWEETIETVNKHNEEFKKGNETFTMGINQFADGTKPAMGLCAHLN